MKRENSSQCKGILSESNSTFVFVDVPHRTNSGSFADVESMIATRISLLQAARQKDERGQIGTLSSPEAQDLLHFEKVSLLQLSEAARRARQPQVALNSVVRLSRLDSNPTFEVQQELANVLWLQREQKTAITCLQKEMRRRKTQVTSNGSISAKIQLALALAQLVRFSKLCAIPIFII